MNQSQGSQAWDIILTGHRTASFLSHLHQHQDKVTTQTIANVISAIKATAGALMAGIF